MVDSSTRDWFEGWPGQYRRMLRWRARTALALRSDDGDAAYDFLYAFFQSCYHLKDWILSTGDATKLEIDSFLKGSMDMQLCKSICNATKHLQLDQPHVDPRPMIAREWDPWTKAPRELALYGHGTTDRIPISDLMQRCIAAWEAFLSAKGLTVPTLPPVA
jgi:hypothetical protein